MSDPVVIALTVLATLLVCVGLYRVYALAKREEPKALGTIVLAALHAVELEIVAKQAAADAAKADAADAVSQLAQIRAQVAGTTNATPGA